ncbi:MAG: glycosyltransferase family 39 protein [Acidimicrobiales bacterium]
MTTALLDTENAEFDPTENSAAKNPVSIGRPVSPGRFRAWLTGIVATALGLRVGYVLLFTRYENKSLYDAFWYQVMAEELRIGEFFRVPLGTAPSAAHPPLTSLLLGAVYFVVGLHGDTSTIPRLTEAVLGALVVLFVGLLGRSIAGGRVGLVAALLTALAPDFWIPSGIVMSETPAMLLMALILLAIVRYLRAPGLWRAALIGVACGAEALVRAELILFVPTLLLPAVLAARTVPLRQRMGQLGLGLLATLLVLAPWVGRNLAAFTDPTYLSTGNGLALRGANCPQAYYGSQLGSWVITCAISNGGPGDESVLSARKTHAAVQYAEHHLSRLPVVVLARVGREWSFYRPAQEAYIESGEGRPVPATNAGTAVYYLMLPLTVAGIVIFRRRRIRQWYLLVPAGVLILVCAVFYGLIRFRAPFEVCMAVLAAAPLVLLGERLRRPRRVAPEPEKEREPAY